MLSSGNQFGAKRIDCTLKLAKLPSTVAVSPKICTECIPGIIPQTNPIICKTNKYVVDSMANCLLILK
jgi:hypothetical protein